MNVFDLFQTLRNAPELLLEESHPMTLWAYLNGYALGNQSIADALRAIDGDFEGPSAACGFTKAYLLFDQDEAFLKLLDSLEKRLLVKKEVGRPTSAFQVETFTSTVVDAIRAGKPGMMLGETTLIWFANFHNGFLAGAEEVDKHNALRARAELATFASWLAEFYSAPTTTWHKILRAYVGPGELGLTKFAQLWVEHKKPTPAPLLTNSS